MNPKVTSHLKWINGLLFLPDRYLDFLADPQIGNALRKRWETLPRVGFLRPPYVFWDGTSLCFSLQAICALAGNSAIEEQDERRNTYDKAAFYLIWQWGRDTILAQSAYHEFVLPPKPWGPLPSLKKHINGEESE